MSSVTYASGGAWEILGHKRHEAAFYAEHRQRRDEAIARGQDPYADYKKQVAEKRHIPRSERVWNKLTGKSSKGKNEAEADKSQKRDYWMEEW